MSYTAVVLNAPDQELLRGLAASLGHHCWEVKCHHLTFHMGPPSEEEKKMLGDAFLLRVDALGESDKAVALRVSDVHNCKELPMKRIVLNKAIPHVTLLVNRAIGGKPVDSNDITEWTPLEVPFLVTGRLSEEQ